MRIHRCVYLGRVGPPAEQDCAGVATSRRRGARGRRDSGANFLPFRAKDANRPCVSQREEGARGGGTEGRENGGEEGHAATSRGGGRGA